MRPTAASTLLSPAQFQRVGRGKEFQFLATEQELVEVLKLASPPEFGPYSLLGEDLIREQGSTYFPRAFTCSSLDFRQCRTGRPEGSVERVLFWLCAEGLTARSALTSADAYAINGLILIDPGTVGTRGRGAARIAFVDKVSDGDTTLTHKQYAQVFAALKKHLSRLLVRDATRTNRTGERVPLGIKFSRGALEEIAQGRRYAATPAEATKDDRFK